MIRFEKYIKIENTIRGVISIDHNYNNGYVDNYIFQNMNRALDGDIVYYTIEPLQIVDVERQKYKSIIGILQIMSITTYGVNKKGVYYYLFKPELKNMPKFYIPFDLKKPLNKEYKKNGVNIYCVIQFENWDCDSLYPRGSIVKIIGSVGSINAEYDYILHKYNINYKKNKIKKDNKLVESIDNKLPEPIDENNDIISIDPPGCTDIDDALHFKLLDKNKYEIGIHIADVTRYVKYMSEIDIEARKRLSTIYTPNKRIDMLPPWLSTNICSLHPGEPKYTASLIVHFEEIDGFLNLINYSFVKKIIISKKALTYDEADKILKKKKNIFNLHSLMDVANKIENKYKFNVGSDKSHKLVEIYMVFANMLAAKHLIETKIENPLVRTHYSKSTFDQKKLDEIKDAGLKNHMYILNMNRAMYEIPSANKEIFHTGLNIKYYTHYTSPIRRYADVIVHRLLFDNNKIDEQILDLTDQINDTNKRIKMAQRDFDLLSIIDKLNDEPVELYGYITSVTGVGYIVNEKITIYITEYKLCITFRLYDRKLNDMLEYKLDNDVLSIKNIQTDEIIKFKILDKIKVRIVPYLKENVLKDKLKVRVIEPKLSI